MTGHPSVAITGATGFLGRHVVAELERRQIPTILLCRPGAVVPPWLARHPVVRRDVRDAGADTFDALGRPTTMIHLAWSGLPNYRSRHHVEAELPAQDAFLTRMVESGLTNCVVAGTCFEYGQQSGALSEDMDAKPDTPYACAKDALRRQLEGLRQQRPFNLTWARLFYLFGEGQSPTSLWPQLARAVEEGQREFKMSGGEQLRDYLPVATAAAYLVSLALPQQHNGIVNVCSGSPVSVRTLVERWIDENGWSIALRLGYHPYPDYEPMDFWGDARKLYSITGAAVLR